VHAIWLSPGAPGDDLETALAGWVAAGAGSRPEVHHASPTELTSMAGSPEHQGIVATADPYVYVEPETILKDFTILVALDEVQDPHNLGAIIRTADAAGADGVVIPERRAAGVTGTVAKASAGASEHLPIARVTNIARTLQELKEQDVWIVGLDERGPQPYDSLDYNMDCALVLGAEGKGLHDLVRRRCDFLVSIPMLGKVPSLNVSVAAGVVMCEVARQRRAASPRQAAEDRK
jgi:23S rRNA (guanosine2251-2'-O)-methyltransferase